MMKLEFGGIIGRPHAQHVVPLPRPQSRAYHERSRAQMILDVPHRKIEVSTIVRFHNLEGRLDVERTGEAGAAPSEAEYHIVRQIEGIAIRLSLSMTTMMMMMTMGGPASSKFVEAFPLVLREGLKLRGDGSLPPRSEAECSVVQQRVGVAVSATIAVGGDSVVPGVLARDSCRIETSAQTLLVQTPVKGIIVKSAFVAESRRLFFLRADDFRLFVHAEQAPSAAAALPPLLPLLLLLRRPDAARGSATRLRLSSAPAPFPSAAASRPADARRVMMRRIPPRGSHV
mmetsp:Transcript_6759/g.20048  ORF Transcript_6759/g.20048 Transcript_6759/m.20048 type:complete len:286 (+) Transcript_6759:1679-2536(+)